MFPLVTPDLVTGVAMSLPSMERAEEGSISLPTLDRWTGGSTRRTDFWILRLIPFDGEVTEREARLSLRETAECTADLPVEPMEDAEDGEEEDGR